MTSHRSNPAYRFAGAVPLRLIIPLILAVVAFIVGVSEHVIYGRSARAGIEREGLRDLNLDMTRLQASLEEAGRANNPSWMQEQVAALGADTHGLMAVLADDSGVVVASASRPQIGRPLQEIIPARLRETDMYAPARLDSLRALQMGATELTPDGDEVVGAFPVLIGMHENEVRLRKTGILLVARDLAILKSQELAGARQHALAMGLVLLIAAGSVSVFLHFLVTRRLARISKATEQLAGGDLSATSGVRGRDEIALLGQRFDAMVSELRQNAAALLESKEQHHSLFDNAVEGIVTMGEDRLILSINPAAQKLFGYLEDELIGKNVKILMPSPYHEEHDGYVKNYIDTGEKKIIGIGREVVGRRKDGETFPLELSIAELKLTDRRVFTGILRDITARKRAEGELRRVNENLEELVGARTKELEAAQETLVRKERLATLGQLAGSVAHEVRNPLGIVRNAAFYIEQMTTDPDEDMAESFDEIRRGLSRADRIIAELLDYARDPQSNHIEFPLQDTIIGALEGIEIPKIVAISLPDPMPAANCHGDRDQVTRILNNLIVNGIQAMPEGGSLKIRCIEAGDGKAIIEVIDQGIGMTPEQLGRVFEPLFTTKTRGIGLGLALSRRYAQLNDATLTVESEIGRGATFRLTVPVIS
ncbi:MAG: two-component system sensor kinase FixL [Verrucomicrobiales bacterium]|jgi:two-component system sensor kinase FixL